MRVKPTKKEYAGQEVTIIWQAHKCIHSERCWRNLPEVFRYGQRPWVDPDGAEGEKIRHQIEQCPSGALTYVGQEKGLSIEDGDLKAKVIPNGPIMVQGSIMFSHADGSSSIEKNPVLCRCGGSANKPFCDGTHKRIGFEG
ncbi:(4Fe-4S)-binding protein [Croceimicrobium hydrocarbonivorans]|uniref:(4Fe-4S)-binding protein n=1 Tax=Croceimicrobium hydrocarbonivorans TaxID=2761580 RepID=A0A7H0VJ50_9FLAO|nr:(4Fe-4S)-binding protein [Croceimicrobium hydrocarbonivorans]QNR25748.1 (4Fe-4S)-binding protein [Croceimicrobium hydrocarbonivorans]